MIHSAFNLIILIELALYMKLHKLGTKFFGTSTKSKAIIIQKIIFFSAQERKRNLDSIADDKGGTDSAVDVYYSFNKGTDNAW